MKANTLWRFVVASIALASLANPVAARFDAELAASVEAALRPGIDAGARVAVRVVDADSGAVLLETPNADDAFIPASNMKLVTTATALDLYGPDKTLATTFTVQDGTLVINAGGDPAFGDPSLLEERGLSPMDEFVPLAEALKSSGITELPGGVVVVDAIFDEQLVHPSWHPANLLHWYGAPVAGVSFNDNCVDVTFRPSKAGRPAELEFIPPIHGFDIRGEALTASLEEHGPELAKLPGEDVLTVGGKVGRVGGPYSKPAEDPRRFLATVTAAALRDHDIVVGDAIEIRTKLLSSDGLSLVQYVAETPILDVLRRVNTNSQNMMAEAVAKLSGLAHDQQIGVPGPRGSWLSGHHATANFLERIEVESETLVAADGSGLSRDNRISAELVTDLLQHMLVEHEHGEHYMGTMAISGVRGSVRNRMGKDAMAHMKGRVYAKTGTIRGVSALSGYVFHDSGRVLVFSILQNGIEGSATPYRQQQDDAVAAMWRWLDGQPIPDADTLEDRSEQMLESIEAVTAVGAAGS
ncbi:MAG: D-alanyl-D-alanine carboxypeptidase/D-alanyl-D-alanine-endopeptidase [Planctomycetota bacterium]